MQGALKFWDNFDYGLYVKILKVRNNEQRRIKNTK